MKAVGRRSAAAGLTTLLNVAWYGIVASLVLTLVLVAIRSLLWPFAVSRFLRADRASR